MVELGFSEKIIQEADMEVEGICVRHALRSIASCATAVELTRDMAVCARVFVFFAYCEVFRWTRVRLLEGAASPVTVTLE